MPVYKILTVFNKTQSQFNIALHLSFTWLSFGKQRNAPTSSYDKGGGHYRLSSGTIN